MKVRILRHSNHTVQGLALKFYRPDQVYDLPATLASYLVTEGLAMVEMRSEEHLTTPVYSDRRRNPANRKHLIAHAPGASRPSKE